MAAATATRAIAARSYKMHQGFDDGMVVLTVVSTSRSVSKCESEVGGGCTRMVLALKVGLAGECHWQMISAIS